MFFEKSAAYKKDEVKRLVIEAAEAEGCKPFLKICQDSNFHKELISNFYIYHGDKLAGFMNLFNPIKNSAEVFSVVHPDYRRRGIFNGLLEQAKKEIEKYGITEVQYLNEISAKSGAECLAHLGYKKSFSEYTLKYCGDKVLVLPEAVFKNIEQDSVELCVKAAQQIYEKDYEDVKAMVENNISSPHNTMIAIMDGSTISGFGSYETDDRKASVYGFAVLPDYRGRGLSKILLSEIIRRIHLAGIDDIYLEVDSENLIAYNLYKKFGFRHFQQIDYYTKG